MSISPFNSDKELVEFAKVFFRNRLETFRKDVAICMTPNSHGQHAYFPALFLCIGFADLLSALYAGKVWAGLDDLLKYALRFLRSPEYTAGNIEILYECLRHKLAHLAYPYAVFDTDTSKRLRGRLRRRVTWTICASALRPAIKLVNVTPPRDLRKTPTPWRVDYDCRIVVNVRRFHIDIAKSIYGASGYLRHLELDTLAREHFAKCMVSYFPP
jgi:hypothetical protein